MEEEGEKEEEEELEVEVKKESRGDRKNRGLSNGRGRKWVENDCHFATEALQIRR